MQSKLNSSRIKNKIGRSSLYSQEIADEICSRIALGESLRKICEDEHLPSYTTVMNWLKEHSTFLESYARAREDQADTIYAEIMEVEERLESGEIEPNTARVLGDLKRWRAARMKPRVYGDSRQIEISDKDKYDHLTDKQLADLVNGLLTKIGIKALPDPDVIEGEIEENTCESVKSEGDN